MQVSLTNPLIITRFIIVFLISFASLYFTSLTCFGQANHDLTVQYCLATTPELFDYSNDLATDLMGTDLERNNISWSGGIYGTYRYFFIEMMSVSAILGYNRIWSDLFENGEIYGESIRDFYTIGVEWHIHYIRLEKFQMYSGAGLAATFVYEDNSYYQKTENTSSKSNLYPNFNFTFIGVRFGGNFAVFLENGIGYKGLISFGLSCQF